MKFSMRYIGKRVMWAVGLQTRGVEDWAPWRSPMLEDELPKPRMLGRLRRRRDALPPPKPESFVEAAARQPAAFFPQDYGRREPPNRLR